MTSGKRAATIPLDSLKQKNAGKVQFNAVREEVLALLDKGYSRSALYAVLHEQGAFTGSYRRFCEYARGIGNREHSKKKTESIPAPSEKAAPIAPKSPAQQPAQPEKPAASGFVHTNRPDINDLI